MCVCVILNGATLRNLGGLKYMNVGATLMSVISWRSAPGAQGAGKRLAMKQGISASRLHFSLVLQRSVVHVLP